MRTPRITIVVVTYNSAEYLSPCLHALRKLSYPNLELQIIDNNSTDATSSFLKKKLAKWPYPVTFHQNRENVGYARANNQAVMNTTSEFVFILNPDTVVTPHCLEPLVTAAKKHTNGAAFQPTVYLSAHKQELNLTGKVTHYLGFDWLKDYRSTHRPPEQELTSFSGSGILIRTALFKKLKGFDDLYFMYHEDSDLSWRMRLAGYTIWYVPESVIYHDYKYKPLTTQQSFAQKFYYAERNRLITLIKNYQLGTLIQLLPMIVLMEFSLVGYAATQGLLQQKLSTYAAIWKHRNSISKMRRRTQHSRRVSDEVITTPFMSTITFAEFNHPVLNYGINPLLKVWWSARQWVVNKL